MIPEEAEKLIREGYRFENYEIYPGGYFIRFNKPSEMYKTIHFIDGQTPFVEERPISDALGSQFVSEEMSRQIVQFSIDHRYNNDHMQNWTAWTNSLDHFDMRIGRFHGRVHITNFENARLRFENMLAGIEFPHIIAPVASIIREFAQYSFYEFLVEKYKIFSEKVKASNTSSRTADTSRNYRNKSRERTNRRNRRSKSRGANRRNSRKAR